MYMVGHMNTGNTDLRYSYVCIFICTGLNKGCCDKSYFCNCNYTGNLRVIDGAGLTNGRTYTVLTKHT